jgi:hypothetical protein
MSAMPQDSTRILCWPKRLLSADDLRRHLTSQRELLLLPRTVITPLAADELKARGVRISWQTPTAKEASPPARGGWCYAQERSDALILSAIQALERDGITLTPLDITATSASWARSMNVAQVGRIKKTLGANLFAIEMPGRTFFEVRQMLRAIVAGEPICCASVATILKELDGHAHR